MASSINIIDAAPPTPTTDFLWVWGKDTDWQLGINFSSNVYFPVQVGEIPIWQSSSFGAISLAAIDGDGNLYTAGKNTYGQLGILDRAVIYSVPTQIGLGAIWSQVSSGENSCGAIMTDGTLWSWGENNTGQLGLDDRISRSSPVQVGLLTDWEFIYMGDHSASIKTDGTLWMWGQNSWGQLGLGDTSNRSSPTQVGALTDWYKVSGGANHTIALKSNGTLWSWGYNTYGQLGLGSSGASAHKSSPEQIGSDTDWYDIACGEDSSYGVKSNGTLWSWGRNFYAALGTNDKIDRSSPTQIGSLTDWNKITASRYSVACIKTDGTLWTWGENGLGELGLATVATNLSDTVDRSSPCQVGSGTEWRTVSDCSSFASSMGATRNTGGVSGYFLGGYNFYHQLGLGYSGQRISPIYVGAADEWYSVKFGNQTCAWIKNSDRTLWMTGYGNYGTLGFGADKLNKSLPTQLGSEAWEFAITNNRCTAAIKTDGTLWTWGENTQGQLGLGNSTSTSSPQQVGALTDWLDVSIGDDSNFMIAIKTNGSLWAWGLNFNGQLGFGNITNRSSPEQVGADTNWIQTAICYTSSFGVKSNGTLWSWGSNAYGQLGQGDVTIQRSSPTQIGSDTDWIWVHAGYYSVCAIKSNGTLWAWGENSYGSLGLEDRINRSSPVQVGSDTNWVEAYTARRTIGIKSDGTVYSWGQGNSGQLLQGDLVHRSSPTQIGFSTSWTKLYGGPTDAILTKE